TRSTVSPRRKGGAAMKEANGNYNVPDMESIEELVERGKQQGSLTYREIMDALQDAEISPEQIDEIYDRLARLGVDIVADAGDLEPVAEPDDPLPAKDDVSEISDEDLDLDLPAGIGLDDPVRMYLK